MKPVAVSYDVRGSSVKGHPLWRTYMSYAAMKRRCLDPNRDGAEHYFDKNIKVCDRWLGKTGFSNFLEDMDERPTGMTLDRIDSSKNYSPDNCRWATPTEQTRNRSITRTHDSVPYVVLCKKYNVKYHTLMTRLRTNMDLMTALTTPINTKYSSRKKA